MNIIESGTSAVSGRQGDHFAAQPADAAAIELANKWLQACVERDGDYVDQNSIAEPPASFVSIATAGEPFNLPDFTGHLRGLKKVAWTDLHPYGYMVGDVAWFTGVAKGVLPWGEALTIRLTLVMRRVGGSWKVVHSHVSEGVDRSGIEMEE